MKYILLLFTLFTIGCVSHGKYYVEVSGRHNVIKESFFEPESALSAYNIEKTELSGTGGQLALITVSDLLYTRLSYYMVGLSADEFTYSNAGVPTTYRDLKVNTSGFDADIGIKLWHFYPYIAATYTNLKFKNNSDPALIQLLPADNFLFSNHISQLGAGLAIDIPLASRLSLFLNVRVLEDQQSYSAGIIFGGWQFGDSNGSTKSKIKSRN